MKAQVLSAFRHALPAHRACPWHAHDGIEMVFHVEGTGWTETADGGRWDFRPGDVLVYPARLQHIQYMTRSGVDECVVMECHGVGWPDRLRSVLQVSELADPGLKMTFHALTEGITGMDLLDRFECDCRAGLLLGAILKQVEGGCAGRRGQDPCWAEYARRLIAEAPAALRRPKDVARTLGISEGHLRHVFKAHYGFSLQQDLIDARLDRAAELLRHSPLTVKAIACECGFRTPRYFSTAFRKQYGCQPQTFRADPCGHARPEWGGRKKMTN